MSAIPKKRFTSQEYLERERKSDLRNEFYSGEIFAMSGASFEHTCIVDNLVFELTQRLLGGSCRVLSKDMRVKVNASGLYTYPDLIVVCGKPDLEDSHGDTLLNPQIIFEVLSPTTEAYDRGQKFNHYRQIPTLKEYVLVSQDRPMIERYIRQSDVSWNLTDFKPPQESFELLSVAASVKIADVYRSVQFQNIERDLAN